MSTAERWVALIAGLSLVIISAALFWAWPLLAVAFDGQRASRSFYAASDSRLPTIAVNDRITPRRIEAGRFTRGMVTVADLPDNVRIFRVVGLPGDQVAVDGGEVIINGRRVAQWPAGGPRRAERLPGEDGEHHVLDLGSSAGDLFGPVRVAPGHLFVLGDNRDRAADSRFGPEDFGVGQIATADVIGEVDIVLRRDGWRYRAYPIDKAPAPALPRD